MNTGIKIMKEIKLAVAAFLLSTIISGFSQAQDWPNLERFKDENAEMVCLNQWKKNCFYGNSINEGG
jgi:hypothetical protein